MLKRTPIALLNLIHDKLRFIISLGVIGFAVFLMFMQMGFRNALLDSNVEFIRKLDADLIIVSKKRYASFIEQTFDINRLYQAQGFSGVYSANPFYIGTSILKNKNNFSERPIRVFAYNLDDSVFNIEKIGILENKLSKSNNLLLDIKSRVEYGIFNTQENVELGNHKFRVAGFFELGTDFIADGNLIVNDQTFLKVFKGIPAGIEANIRNSLSEVDIGLIKLNNRVQANDYVKILSRNLPQDVDIFTKKSFIKRDLNYWLNATPIGFMFVLGTIVGFVVGAIVLYNILYTDIDDNLGQYATLKAIGYPNHRLVSIVVQEALILATLGYLPGYITSFIFYNFVADSTGIQMRLTLSLALLIMSLTLLMSIISGLFAVRRLRSCDPAEIFS